MSRHGVFQEARPDLLVMAETHISSDQQAEILTMKGLLAQWAAEPSSCSKDRGFRIVPQDLALGTRPTSRQH